MRSGIEMFLYYLKILGHQDIKLRVGEKVAHLIGEEFGNFGFMDLAAVLYPETSAEDWQR